MQLPDVPGLPHTRARAAHWLTTAAALAAVTGAAALAGPSGATASPGRQAAAAPDATAADYPMDCGPLPRTVTAAAAVDFDGDGQAETVAAVRCEAGSGTPPHGVYLLTGPAGTGAAPRVAETLVDPRDGMTVSRLRSDGSEVSLRLLGYSSAEVPRCCPDQRRDVSWSWQDGRLELRAESVAGSSV